MRLIFKWLCIIIQTEEISRYVYISLSLDVPQKVIKELEKVLYNFIWRKKCHYLKKIMWS